MSVYLFKRGRGGEGNFPRLLVQLGEGEMLQPAFEALLASEYMGGGRQVRRYILKHVRVLGASVKLIRGMVETGPEGEGNETGPWLTGEMELLSEGDAKYYQEMHGMALWKLREVLDNSMWRAYEFAVRKSQSK